MTRNMRANGVHSVEAHKKAPPNAGQYREETRRLISLHSEQLANIENGPV